MSDDLHGDTISEEQDMVRIYGNALSALSVTSPIWDLVYVGMTSVPLESKLRWVAQIKDAARLHEPLAEQLVAKATELRILE
jgi:hypothetical protein